MGSLQNHVDKVCKSFNASPKLNYKLLAQQQRLKCSSYNIIPDLIQTFYRKKHIIRTVCFTIINRFVQLIIIHEFYHAVYVFTMKHNSTSSYSPRSLHHYYHRNQTGMEVEGWLVLPPTFDKLCFCLETHVFVILLYARSNYYNYY